MLSSSVIALADVTRLRVPGTNGGLTRHWQERGTKRSRKQADEESWKHLRLRFKHEFRRFTAKRCSLDTSPTFG
jgi:hypothetical protein